MSAEHKLISMQSFCVLSPSDVPHPDALVGAARHHQGRVSDVPLLDGDTSDIAGVT